MILLIALGLPTVYVRSLSLNHYIVVELLFQ